MEAKAIMERVKKLLENIHITVVQKIAVRDTTQVIFTENYSEACQQ
ncbi:hypothetical protein [Chryseobacterium ginsenosidimutans]|nr:hypothetical protein [Chryseobacterium ginsenosidimutans]